MGIAQEKHEITIIRKKAEKKEAKKQRKKLDLHE
jgi:hypothetical protein